MAIRSSPVRSSPVRSFRGRLTLALILSAAVAGSIATALTLWMGGLVADSLVGSADGAAFAILVDVARDHARRGELDAVTHLLEHAATSPSIEQAVLVDGERRIVAASDPERIGEPFLGGPAWVTASIDEGGTADGSAGLIAASRRRGVWLATVDLPAVFGFVLALSATGLGVTAAGPWLFRRLRRLHREAQSVAQVPSAGDELATLGHALDVLKREVEALRLAAGDRDRQLRSITDDLPLGLSYVDDELRMRFLNRTLEHWLGWKRSAILGRRLSDFMTPAHFQETLRGLEPALRGAKVQRERDFTIDGEPAVISSINVPDRAPDGAVRGVFSLLRDVTRPRAQGAERERLLGELAAKNAELERFAYTVSHDLKSPLTTIVSSADLVALAVAEAGPGAPPSVDEDLQRIRDTAGTMRRMLDELLDLARVGLVANQETRVDLGQLAAETVRLLAGSIARHGTRTTIADDLPTVLGDRRRLQRVLQNLVDNAVKFSAGAEAPQVEIGRRRDGDETVIYVRDNGCGIPPQQQSRVFDLFSKLDGDSEGTGIGLAIVQRIVTGHGGRLWVESAGEGHGAAFCFTLPLAEGPVVGAPLAAGPLAEGPVAEGPLAEATDPATFPRRS